MKHRSDLRARWALSKRKARVLRRFGDELIHSIRTQKPTTIWVPTTPSRGQHMDMGHWNPRPGKPFRAYFHDPYDHRLIPVRLQVTGKKVDDSCLLYTSPSPRDRG